MNKEELIKDIYFQANNMSVEERDYLLELLSNCIDISNSKYGSVKCGELITCEMFKINESLISFSASASYGDENRVIEGNIHSFDNGIIIDSKVSRLCAPNNIITYTVLDKFSQEESGLTIISQYNNDSTKYKRYVSLKGEKDYGKNKRS